MSNKAYVAIQSVGADPCISLVDAFGGSSLNVSNWTSFTGSGCSVAEASGSLTVSASSGNAAGVYSASSYNLTGLGVQVEVTNPGAAASGNSSTWLGLMAAASPSTAIDVWTTNTLFMALDGGTMYCGHGNGGSQHFDVSAFTYDATAHKFWRIAEQGGDILFFTSPDGLVWVQQGGVGDPFSVTSLYPVLEAVGGSTSSAPEYANFGTALQGLVVSTVTVLSSSGEVVASSGAGLPSQSVAAFTYGATQYDIESALTSVIQGQMSDPSLDIEFI